MKVEQIKRVNNLNIPFSPPSIKETHQLAAAQLEKNAKLRSAFGISAEFVEGSSLDPARREKEAATRALAERDRAEREKAKRYTLIRTPSPEQTAEEVRKSATKKRKRRDR